MTIKSDRNITNVTLLATVVETTRESVKQLDGQGINLSASDNRLTDDVLNQLIVSRIKNKLGTPKQ